LEVPRLVAQPYSISAKKSGTSGAKKITLPTHNQTFNGVFWGNANTFCLVFIIETNSDIAVKLKQKVRKSFYSSNKNILGAANYFNRICCYRLSLKKRKILCVIQEPHRLKFSIYSCQVYSIFFWEFIMEKTFILGVGCQKSGTTWLYKQLIKCKFVDMGFVKEYHVLDAKYMGCNVPVEKTLKIRSKLTRKWGVIKSQEEKNLDLLVKFRHNIDSYYNFFDKLISTKPEVNFVGDISPSYAGLSVEALKEVKANLEKRGYTIKVIFLMRDPFERICSAVRMSRRPNRRKTKELITSKESDTFAYYKSKDCRMRTQYEKTVRNLDAVFEPDQVFYSIYEKLFSKQENQCLEKFLNIADFKPEYNELVNMTKRTETISEQLKRDIVNYYADTYSYCEKRFNTKGMWSNNKVYKAMVN
jgi:hypothetical protein